FFSSRRGHTRLVSDWSSDVCSSDLYMSIDSGAIAVSAPRITISRSLRATGSDCRVPALVTVVMGGYLSVTWSGGSDRGDGLLVEIGRASCRGRGGVRGVGEAG